jgi:hypothetical protein
MRAPVLLLLTAACAARPTPPPERQPLSGEDSFAAMCVPAMQAASVISRSRNPGPVGLSPEQKVWLEPLYGEVVHDIKVHWDARLIHGWKAGGQAHVMGDTSAMTLGDHVFYAGPHRPGALDQIVILAHELQHSAQARSRGGLPGFANAYCRAYYRSGYDYWTNALEVEARQMARQICERGALPCE